ncbi:3-oxoacyl-(acyl carrier protein) synthase 2 [Gammaproteobacteria bacterium]
MNKRRVVVTGLGMVSPLGLSVQESWAGILAGQSGVSPITSFDVSTYAVRISATIRGFEASRYLPPKEVKKMDPFIHYAIAASQEALQDSGLEITEANAERIGVEIGSGMGGLPGIEVARDTLVKSGARRVSPFFVPSCIVNMASGNLSIFYKLKGPNLSIVTACATGTHSIGDAGRLIEYGDADVMVAGGAEMCTCPLGISGFSSAKALSTRNDEPTKASRPWDRDRDGFVIGEGAGILILEEYEHARARGAKIYAELAGFGLSGDGFHMTAPKEDGEGAARCMSSALRNAGLRPEQVDYINAHGTSTPLGDLAETRAVKRVFGSHAYQLAMSSTKSMIGHGLGAAGGMEAVFCVLALRDQVAPPTINLENPGEECDLDYVPNVARQMRIEVAMSNSFGFGGTNGTLIFQKLQ